MNDEEAIAEIDFLIEKLKAERDLLKAVFAKLAIEYEEMATDIRVLSESINNTGKRLGGARNWE